MTWTLRIRNVAGITEGDAALAPGINAVRADNWRGKSSFLAAIETVMGTEAPLTEGRRRGRVELETGDGERFAVDLAREAGAVVRSGDPYLADEYDAVRADLYAFLDESNAVRRAVRNGENLADVLTRPLDFEDLDARIADLRARREEIDAELARAREAAERLPTVVERIDRLEDERNDLRERRDALAGGATPGAPDAREELSDVRAERTRVAGRIDRLARAVERTEETLAAVRAERDDLPDPAEGAGDLDSARDALREIERDADLLQSMYSVTERLLEEDRLDLVTEVERGVAGDAFACPTCGAETDREAVAARLERIGDRLADRRAAAATRRERVAELEAAREERARVEREREALADRIGELETALADRRASLGSARDRLDELDARAADLAEGVGADDDRLVEVEGEIKYVESRLAEIREERGVLAAQAEKRRELTADRERLAAEIEELRNRKDALRRRTREAFDAAMSEILTRFDTGFETARLTSTFDLVVAREGREASLDALSEGELELLGFVAALAGHEAFDVADRVPVLLLDGLGGLADQNLHALVDYIRDRARFVVFTAYPEHGTFDGHEIDPADWTVVSRPDDS